MYIDESYDVKRYGVYTQKSAQGTESGGKSFGDSVRAAERRGRNGQSPQTGDVAEERAAGRRNKSPEEMEEEFRRLDEELDRVREENKKERERLQEARLRKKRIRKKLMEKLAWKKYLARQDEIRQMNEKIALERAVGEDVYIEKPPLSKSLSVAEIMAICSES